MIKARRGGTDFGHDGGGGDARDSAQGPQCVDEVTPRGGGGGDSGHDYPPDHCIRDTIAEPRRRPGRSEYTTHAIFFPAGITVIEYLTNLDQIGAARCRFMALPLKLEGADGSPVRAIALVE
jgi:hypothetical protein